MSSCVRYGRAHTHIWAWAYVIIHPIIAITHLCTLHLLDIKLPINWHAIGTCVYSGYLIVRRANTYLVKQWLSFTSSTWRRKCHGQKAPRNGVARNVLTLMEWFSPERRCLRLRHIFDQSLQLTMWRSNDTLSNSVWNDDQPDNMYSAWPICLQLIFLTCQTNRLPRHVRLVSGNETLVMQNTFNCLRNFARYLQIK